MAHGFLDVCCHRLKTTALGHEAPEHIYSPVTSAYKLFFTSLLSQLYTVTLALKSTVARSGAYSVEGLPLPLLSGFSPGVGFFCIPILVAKRTRERAGALGHDFPHFLVVSWVSGCVLG